MYVPVVVLASTSPLIFMNYMFTIPLRVSFYPENPPYWEIAFVSEPAVSVSRTR